jgi:hypothetical protein
MHRTNYNASCPGRGTPPKKPLLTHFMIRGEAKAAETAEIAECCDLLEVVSRGARNFIAFHQRNPWIFSDSVRGCAYVLLDPETDVLGRAQALTQPHILSGGGRCH